MGGCCCSYFESSTDTNWTVRHKLLLDHMRRDGYAKAVWSEFKRNTNSHGCLEYDEFRSILYVALEIYDKIQIGTSRQISYAMEDVHHNTIQLMTEKELN